MAQPNAFTGGPMNGTRIMPPHPHHLINPANIVPPNVKYVLFYYIIL